MQALRHLPFGEDDELHRLTQELRGFSGVSYQSLEPLKPCGHPESPMHRVGYASERKLGAEVCLQVRIFDQVRYGSRPSRKVEARLTTAERLLKQLRRGMGRGMHAKRPSPVPRPCATILDASSPIPTGVRDERPSRKVEARLTTAERLLKQLRRGMGRGMHAKRPSPVPRPCATILDASSPIRTGVRVRTGVRDERPSPVGGRARSP